jgi:hypothetical protein
VRPGGFFLSHSHLTAEISVVSRHDFCVDIGKPVFSLLGMRGTSDSCSERAYGIRLATPLTTCIVFAVICCTNNSAISALTSCSLPVGDAPGQLVITGPAWPRREREACLHISGQTQVQDMRLSVRHAVTFGTISHGAEVACLMDLAIYCIGGICVKCGLATRSCTHRGQEQQETQSPCTSPTAASLASPRQCR